jgi:hypothetical protein
MTDSITLSSADLKALLKSAVAEALAAQPKAEAPEPEPEAPKAKPKASKPRKPKLTAAKRAKALSGLAKLFASSDELAKAGPSFRDLAKAKARRWEATLRTFQSVDGVLKDAKPFREAITSLWEEGAFAEVAEATEAHAAALWAAVPKRQQAAVKDKALGLVNDGKASGFAMIQRVLG